MDSIQDRLDQIQQRMARACERSGRRADEVSLLGVSKFHEPDTIAALARAGLRCFGESRVQEARHKIPLCPGNLEWHLIGHLQSNKCRDAVGLFQMIQSVDRMDIAAELQRHAEKQARTVPVLLEVNVAGESSKFGWSPEALLENLDALCALTRLEIHGLMTIAPYATDPEKVRPVFRRLRDCQQRCEEKMGVPLPVLSMGMSGDYEVAIEEGSTLVRIGTALFGPRPKSPGARPD